MHYEEGNKMDENANSEPQLTPRDPRNPVRPPRRVLPITFAEQHGADAIPAKYSMEPHPLPVTAVSRKVADLAGVNGQAAMSAAAHAYEYDFPAEYAVASSLRSSQSGRSSVSSAPSVRSSVSYLTKETTARGLFRKRKTVIDCGVINKFDNG